MYTSNPNPAPKREKTHSPYSAFKNDRARLWALVSRDVRLVVVALIIALAGAPALRLPALWAFFGA